jgi:hypothetical protein
MKQKPKPQRPRRRLATLLIALLLLGSVTAVVVVQYSRNPADSRADGRVPSEYQEKKRIDTSGFTAVLPYLDPWPPTASLEESTRRSR